MADARTASECAFKFIEKFGLWDCTDGELHGGGKTKEDAYSDYCGSVIAEMFESNAGWSR